ALLPTPSSPSSLSFTFFFLTIRRPPTSTLFPYTTLFRSDHIPALDIPGVDANAHELEVEAARQGLIGIERAQADHRAHAMRRARSEEHTSELQSRFDLVCRLLLEKKKTMITSI